MDTATEVLIFLYFLGMSMVDKTRESTTVPMVWYAPVRVVLCDLHTRRKAAESAGVVSHRWTLVRREGVLMTGFPVHADAPDVQDTVAKRPKIVWSKVHKETDVLVNCSAGATMARLVGTATTSSGAASESWFRPARKER